MSVGHVSDGPDICFRIREASACIWHPHSHKQYVIMLTSASTSSYGGCGYTCESVIQKSQTQNDSQARRIITNSFSEHIKSRKKSLYTLINIDGNGEVMRDSFKIIPIGILGKTEHLALPFATHTSTKPHPPSRRVTYGKTILAITLILLGKCKYWPVSDVYWYSHFC